jgi:uncharacterized protein
MTATIDIPAHNVVRTTPQALPQKSSRLNSARNACLRVPPLWPLQSFVAVNPFVGLVGRPFSEVCELMQHVAHQGMVMNARYFQQQFANGRITTQDLSEALEQAQSSFSKSEMLDWLSNPEPPKPSGLQCLADVATEHFGGRWNSLITEEISKWCAAYFDDSQSAWRMPWKKLPLFAAWRQAALVDASPELCGFRGFRHVVATMPENGSEAIAAILDMLVITGTDVEDYLHRLLMTIPGWSSYVQYRVRDKAMHGHYDESLIDLLAVRLVFEVQLLSQFEDQGIRTLWLKSLAGAAGAARPELEKQLLWQSALEIGLQRSLCQQVVSQPAAGPGKPKQRPALQAVFCIDVRSELMRRALEASSPEVETLGFAGFFGMPIEYIPFGQRHGTEQLPVLLSPKHRVREFIPGASPEKEKQVRRQMQLGRRVSHSWNAFRTSAISCFSFVEAAGVGFAWKLVKDAFQLGSHTHTHQCKECTAPNLHQHKRAVADPLDDTQLDAGIPPEDQIVLAEGALRGMGLTSHFARLVMVCGHGSSTKNNPYAAGLDCGACGGHAGDANARIAAALLNQPLIRKELRERGLMVPEDTHFLPALHDTTTDEIRLLDTANVPPSHEHDLLHLHLWLDEASARCRRQRSATLGLGSVDSDILPELLAERSRDWAQVRPEWGLAGNAAFIAAPRERTRHLDLKGRVFLHNYTHQEDRNNAWLEQIMTAPMVVASWINMQYYASTVGNRLWGSGNKVIHNVVGTFGIQQGNGGDIQSGLPLQSLHDGENWMHEPVRLSVFIEAPRERIEAVISKHESVRQLFDNGWLHIFAIENDGKSVIQRKPAGKWEVKM